MSTSGLDILVTGADLLAAIAATWSLLFFGKVKLSSPTGKTAAKKAQPKPEPAEQPAALPEIRVA